MVLSKQDLWLTPCGVFLCACVSCETGFVHARPTLALACCDNRRQILQSGLPFLLLPSPDLLLILLLKFNSAPGMV